MFELIGVLAVIALAYGWFYYRKNRAAVHEAIKVLRNPSRD